jgi:hypothetical protein
MSLILPRKVPLYERNGNHRNGAQLFPARRIPVRLTELAGTWQSSDLMSVMLSILMSVGILLPFVALVPACRHWFIGPVLVCGILIGIDFVDWLRGRMNLLDPVGILGVLGFHAFFLAPLIHVSLDLWMAWVHPPPDWREWLGKMGLVNVAGLAAYLVACRLPVMSGARRPMGLWRIHHRAWVVLAGALVLTAALQAYVYAHFGGIRGYIELFEKETGTGKSSFTGWGWLFNISESFPRLAFMAVVLALWRRGKPSWWILGAILAVYFGLLILFGGLRGLRSNIIWSMFWGVAIVHFCLRPLTRKFVIAGLAGMVGFMVLYSAYKRGGTKDFEKAVAGQETRHGDSLSRVALGDLARSDVQAFLLYRMSRVGTDYKLSWGRTYAGALALLIPEALWPGRPPTKIQEGTQILFGEDAVLIGKASNLYGLAGESMLNFGPASVPVAFAIFALCVRGVRSYVYRLRRYDGRVFLLPVFLSLCILGLVCDSDNVLFFLFQYGTSVGLVLLFTCRPVRSVLQLPGSL